MDILNAHGIQYVVNCQGVDSENYHADKGQITYLRFPIGETYRSPFDMNSSTGVVRYFIVFLDFVGQVMKEGGGYLIHFLAGAFSARIAGVAWLMYANNLSVEDAIKLGKSRRDVIDPIGKFPNTFECTQKWTERRGFEKAYKMELTVERTR